MTANRRRIHATVIAVALGWVSLVPIAQPALAQACDVERGKFVDGVAADGSLLTAYAEKGRMYVYHRVMVSCASVANTIHLGFITATAGSDYIEVGTRQYGPSPISWHWFCSWRVFPNASQYVEDPALNTDQRYVYGKVYTPFGDNHWRCGTSFDGSIWNGFSQAPLFTTDHANPESEISRYGDADLSTQFTQLQRYTSAGSWVNWTNAACSQYTVSPGGDVTSWNAVIDSPTQWHTNEAPVQGAC